MVRVPTEEPVQESSRHILHQIGKPHIRVMEAT